MSDPYREQRPLLCDEYSDEEFHIRNYYQRRNQPSICIGRARTHVKGAAAVLTRWPDNCSTSVAYWWLGVSMIAVTIFVIYNSVLIFGMIPTTNIKQPKYRTFNNGIKTKTQTLSLPEVYMHLIVNNNTDVQLNKYLSHINIISKKYPNFNYNFLLLLNDTLKEIHDFNDDQRNEIALNSLWTSGRNAKKISSKYNITVEYISLTAYLNDSPIKKFWRQLPSHLVQFLIRSISIWEKGGIEFNPIILTPKLPNSKYIENIYTLLNNFMSLNNQHIETTARTNEYLRSNKKRPNNIQDIINALNAGHNNISEVDLNEAESNTVTVINNIENSLDSTLNRKLNSIVGNNMDPKLNLKETNDTYDRDSNQRHDNISYTTNYTYTTDNILPLFIKYLFRTKPNKDDITMSELKKNVIPSTDDLDDSIIYNRNEARTVKKNSNSNGQSDGYNDITNISKNLNKKTHEESRATLKSNKYENMPELSIDIKGNIIASKTPCHAFLGTIFSNVIHHSEEETVTDFIISELSLFCKGLLTSCAGINVILV